MTAKPKFAIGDRVMVKGRKGGPFIVAYPLNIMVPTIIDFEFVLVDSPFYKFIPTGKAKDNFYAYEKDLTLATRRK